VAERRPEQSVQGVQYWARPLAFEHRNLLSTGKDFKGGVASAAAPNRICEREFYRARHNTAHPSASPRSPFLLRPPISPESATHSRPHGTFWKCTDGSSPMTRSGAASSGLTGVCWTSINSSRTSERAKNEERLAGQSASLHKNMLIEAGIVFCKEADTSRDSDEGSPRTSLMSE